MDRKNGGNKQGGLKNCVGGKGVATLLTRSSLLKAMLLLFSRLVYGCRRIWVFKNGKLQEGST